MTRTTTRLLGVSLASLYQISFETMPPSLLKRFFRILVISAMGIFVAWPAWSANLSVLAGRPDADPDYTGYVLHSDRIGRDFAVTVYMPAHSSIFLSGQKFPVIYALDGGYGIAGPVGVLLANVGAMAPAIIVSIGYLPGQKGFRNTDLMHSSYAEGALKFGGGGASFESFLRSDLKPFIESKYPADPNQSILFGHSLGGVFAANIFAEQPGAFAGYIIGSPAAWADPATLERVKTSVKSAHGGRIFLGVGELEGAADANRYTMVEWFRALVAAFSANSALVIKSRIYSGQTHTSYYPLLVADSFAFMLPAALPMNASFILPPKTVTDHYVGVYLMPDGRRIAVTRTSDDRMQAQVADSRPMALFPNGSDRFYSLAADLNITFDQNGATLVGLDGGRLRVEREKAH